MSTREICKGKLQYTNVCYHCSGLSEWKSRGIRYPHYQCQKQITQAPESKNHIESCGLIFGVETKNFKTPQNNNIPCQLHPTWLPFLVAGTGLEARAETTGSPDFDPYKLWQKSMVFTSINGQHPSKVNHGQPISCHASKFSASLCWCK